MVAAAAMTFENRLDLHADLSLGTLGGDRFGGVIVAAARYSERLEDLPDAMTGGSA